jgi:hypothetical protein
MHHQEQILQSSRKKDLARASRRLWRRWFIGTLGAVFNNFRHENLLNKEAYKPWVMVKSIFTTTSEYIFQTYSVSFSEPWFGQKK